MPRTQHFKRTKLWWTSWRPYKTPIHVLHNVMEDAKNNKKALWVAFQDMSKAFDSIGMVPLRHVLNRICLPTLAIDFIINLFQHRKMKRSEEHTSELQSRSDLVCRLLLEKKNNEMWRATGSARTWSLRGPRSSLSRAAELPHLHPPRDQTAPPPRPPRRASRAARMLAYTA